MKMKNILLLLSGIMIVMINLTGMAFAQIDYSTINCPSAIPGEASESYDYGQALYDDISHPGYRQYVVQTIAPPPGYGTSPEIFELCIYPVGTTVIKSQLVALYSGYEVFFPGNNPDAMKDYFGFRRASGPTGTNMPIDGRRETVGEANYGQNKPMETTIFHLIDSVECAPKTTCYRKTKDPYAPVPELSTIILTFSGLLGIVLVSRKNKIK